MSTQKKSQPQVKKGNPIKRLVKDPVKSVEEADARLKTIKKMLLISLTMAIVPFLLAIVLGPKCPEFITTILGIVAFIGIVGALASGLFSTIVKKHRARFEALSCENCKALVTYDENVKFEVLNSYEKRREKTENGRTTVSQTVYVELGIVCKCQQCGTEKLLKREFIKEKWVNANCRFKKENEDLVKGFFDGTILPV